MKNLELLILSLGIILFPKIVASQSEFRQSLLEGYSAYCLNYHQSELVTTKKAFLQLCAGKKCEVIVDVIDTSNLKCGNQPLGYCGSGGCDINFLVDGVNFIERGWDPVNINHYDTSLILLKIPGNRCGNLPNGAPCYKVLSWDRFENRFNSVDK